MSEHLDGNDWSTARGAASASPSQTEPASAATAGPVWLQQAQRRGWVSGPLPAQTHEPSPWLIAVLMVLLGISAVLVLGLLAVAVGEWLLEVPLLMYGLAVGLWLASAHWLKAPRGLVEACLAAVGLLTASAWVAGVALLENHAPLSVVGWAQALALGLTVMWVKPRWLVVLLSALACLWGMAGVLGVAEATALGWESVPDLLWGMCVLLAMGWAVWSWQEGRWLHHAQADRWAAMGDGVCVALLVVVLGLEGTQWFLIPYTELGAWVRGTGVVAAVVTAGALLAWHSRWEAIPQADAHDGVPVVQGRTASWAGMGVLLVLTLACVVQPWLAPVAVVAALAAATARWRWLAVMGAVALWLLSRFYYDLSWPLTTKAAMLAALGALLLLALGVQRAVQASAKGEVQGLDASRTTGLGAGRGKAAVASVLLGALACLALLNVDVMRKERVVREGETLLVALEPVDPRSLMQGDYMDLRFDIPRSVHEALDGLPRQALLREAKVVVQLVQGRARIVRLAKAGEPLAADERLMPLKRLKLQWVLVTDAYFFPEGDAERFERARWGEFRLLPDGRALLVGLSDAQGKAIASPSDLRQPMW